MLRLNTEQEIEELNRTLRRNPNKLVYYNARMNPYNCGWVIARIKDIPVNSIPKPKNYFKIVSERVFFSLKRPNAPINDI